MSQKVTKEQIAQWKNAYPKVYKLNSKDGKKSCYIRKPDFNDVDYATSCSVSSPMSFPKEIIVQCFLGGDEDFKTNVDYIMGVSAVIDEIVKTVEVEVKEV